MKPNSLAEGNLAFRNKRLNKNDHKLEALYEDVLQSFDSTSNSPDEILIRKASVSCMSGLLEQFIKEVRIPR